MVFAVLVVLVVVVFVVATSPELPAKLVFPVNREPAPRPVEYVF